LARELAAVKKERAALMASLAALRRGGGRAGGDLQARDVADLRAEVARKQEALNQLRAENTELAQR
jgi:hypothetical protein